MPRVNCRYCNQPAEFESLERCRRCARLTQSIDDTLEGEPYIVAVRILRDALSAWKSRQQQEFARKNPESYRKAWVKRRERKRAQVSDFLTAAGKKPLK